MRSNPHLRGELHSRAKLTDHEVALLRSLLAERRALIAEQRGAGVSTGRIDRLLVRRRMSYAAIAGVFEVSKSLVRYIAQGKRRP